MTDQEVIQYRLVEKLIPFVFVKVKPDIIGIVLRADEAIEEYRVHWPDVPIVLVSRGTSPTPFFHDPSEVEDRLEDSLIEILSELKGRWDVLTV